jgi:hypothetical protein
MGTDDIRGNKEIAMVTILVSNDNKSFKLALYYIFPEDTNYDDINKRGKRKTCTRALQSRQDLS